MISKAELFARRSELMRLKAKRDNAREFYLDAREAYTSAALNLKQARIEGDRETGARFRMDCDVLRPSVLADRERVVRLSHELRDAANEYVAYRTRLIAERSTPPATTHEPHRDDVEA